MLPSLERRKLTVPIEVLCIHVLGLGENIFCQTPDLGLGLGVDFTFPYNNNNKKENNNNNNNPHLIFHRREGTWGLKFCTQTYQI